jgi:hypothetical protein
MDLNHARLPLPTYPRERLEQLHCRQPCRPSINYVSMPALLCLACATSESGASRVARSRRALAGTRAHSRRWGRASFTPMTACQVARPPFRGLCRGAPAWPVSRPGRAPAIESNHQLFEWVLPPLVMRPLGRTWPGMARPQISSIQTRCPTMGTALNSRWYKRAWRLYGLATLDALSWLF